MTFNVSTKRGPQVQGRQRPPHAPPAPDCTFLPVAQPGVYDPSTRNKASKQLFHVIFNEFGECNSWRPPSVCGLWLSLPFNEAGVSRGGNIYLATLSVMNCFLPRSPHPSSLTKPEREHSKMSRFFPPLILPNFPTSRSPPIPPPQLPWD